MEQDSLFVERGTPGGAVVILLDPLGATNRLSRTWSSLAEQVRLVCFGGFAQDDPLVEARILLEREARTSSAVYLVTSPDGDHIASVLAGHRTDVVQGVFLIRSDGRVPGATAVEGDSSRELHSFLAAHGVFARWVNPTPDGERPVLDRPEAVRAMIRELAALGVQCGRS